MNCAVCSAALQQLDNGAYLACHAEDKGLGPYWYGGWLYSDPRAENISKVEARMQKTVRPIF